MKYKIIIIIIIFAGIIYLAGKQLTEKKPEVQDGENTIRVKRGDIHNSLNVKAFVKPLNVVKIKAKLTGKIIKVPAQKGDYLKEGALIAELENISAKSSVDQSLKELNSAKVRLEKIKTEVETAKDRDQRLLKTAEDNLEKVKRELQKAFDREKMKKALKINNIETESELIKQEVDLRFNISDIQGKISKLSNKGPVSNKEYDSLKKNLETAKSEYDLVIQYLELTKNPVVEEKINVEKFGIKQAELELVKAQEMMKAQKTGALNIIAAESEFLKKQEALKIAEDNLKDTMLTAPISGLILQCVEEGRIISSEMLFDSAGAVIAIMADLSKVYINYEVDKNDLGNIKTGQNVKITTDGFPGNSFEGRVIKIISEKAAAKNAGTFEITVEIENTNTLLKPGINFLFKIILKEAKDVLFVPSDTIQNIDNKKRLFVVQDGKLIKREVKTGLSTRDFTEIISGLEEGEVIEKREKTIEIDISGENKNTMELNQLNGGHDR